MLTVRQTQMDALQAGVEEAFVQRVVMHLRRAHQDVVGNLDDHTLTARVHFGIGRARRLGISHQATLTAFVATMLRSAPCFDAHPLVRQHLEDQEIPPDSRMSRLLACLDDADWDTVIAESRAT